MAHTLNLNHASRELRTGHLRLGGENRLGQTVGVTNQYLTLNGRPFFGISGEFQFSRYPHEDWEDEILKMKAGGVNTIATYVFWIHHEQQPGVFDWSGRRSLRRFIELCGKHGLWVIARVGPFAHGECRNGGLPDWLYGQPFEVRSNDPAYLELVARYFEQVGRQLAGLMFRDGGPVLCVQLENEYEHTGAPWDAGDRSGPAEWVPRGSGGVEHMRRLKALAVQAGLDAPLYTVTGWGSPVIEDETLPVHGGYAYPVWVDNPGPSDLFLFFDRAVQPHPDIRYRAPYYYPLLNAEMQGGIQVRYGNRPLVPARSTEALALVQVGCGSNFLGYYIYHGGSNPFQGTGYTNEVLHPQVSYDFQAPIGEFGEIRDACRGLKILHLFLQTWGERLAGMPPVFPEGSGQLTPTDTTSLRWAGRASDGLGFLFFNNFQDHHDTQPVANIRLDVTLGSETLSIPQDAGFTLQPGVSCIFPLNLDLSGARLVYATAQPLTLLEKGSESLVFFYAPEGIEPEYCLEGDGEVTFTGEPGEVTRENRRTYVRPAVGMGSSFAFSVPGPESAPAGSGARRVRVTTLTRWEAEHAWHGTAWGAARLVISSADPIFTAGGVELRSLGQHNIELTVFPALEGDRPAAGAAAAFEHGPVFTHARLNVPAANPAVGQERRGESKILLRFPPSLMSGIHDLFVKVDYTGDTAGAYINGHLVADHYNNGAPWLIGLRRFLPDLLEHGLTLSFRPLRKGRIQNVSNAMAARLDFEGEEQLEIHSIEFIPEYVIRLLGGP